MRYLVTGGAGFVGAGVTRALLARGDAVTVLDSGVAAGFGAAERGVHLAAQASVPESIARPWTTRRSMSPPRFGCSSSCARPACAVSSLPRRTR